MADKVTSEGTSLVAAALLPKLLHGETPGMRPKVAAAVREMILETDPRGIAAAQRGMAERPDMTSLLPTISVRTLVIVGEQDAISPAEEMRKIADAIPGCAVHRGARGGAHGADGESVVRERALGEFLANELHAVRCRGPERPLPFYRTSPLDMPHRDSRRAWLPDACRMGAACGDLAVVAP